MERKNCTTNSKSKYHKEVANFVLECLRKKSEWSFEKGGGNIDYLKYQDGNRLKITISKEAPPKESKVFPLYIDLSEDCENNGFVSIRTDNLPILARIKIFLFCRRFVKKEFELKEENLANRDLKSLSSIKSLLGKLYTLNDNTIKTSNKNLEESSLVPIKMFVKKSSVPEQECPACSFKMKDTKNKIIHCDQCGADFVSVIKGEYFNWILHTCPDESSNSLWEVGIDDGDKNNRRILFRCPKCKIIFKEEDYLEKIKKSEEDAEEYDKKYPEIKTAADKRMMSNYGGVGGGR